jgi:catechol 2,3-dioxygenase-like lactoylglutathione lyase family enzyme
MPIAHIEIVSSRSPDFQIPEIAGAYGALVDSAQMVDSIDDAIHFYRDILGLTMQGDYRLPRGLVDEVLTLPPGTDSRIAFFNKEGSTGPLVEFLEYSLKGNYLSSVARPPNLGIFMISFETADLSGLISAFNSAGVKILSGPITMDAGPHGAISTMVAEGPGRAMVEFYEKQG